MSFHTAFQSWIFGVSLIRIFKYVCITFGIILLCSSAVLAQSFTVEPNPASASTNLSENPGLFQILAYSVIYNQTDQNLNMKWERIVNDKNECWSSSVDSPNFQSFPGIDEFEFTLLPNLPNGGDLIVHMYIEGYSGEGQVVLRVSNLDIPSDTLLVTYNFTATEGLICSSTSVEEIRMDEGQLYPNPCIDAFQMTNGQNVNELIVYNILGTEVQSFLVQPGKLYSLTNLPKGVYLVQMINDKGALLSTTKLLKQ